jgi:hypothetical protein
MNASAISADEKRRALNELLQSVTLRRAEQVRQFLQYVVEEEIAGRGSQIREWDIAVRALNRPTGYMPETDSTVRTRAFALRQRLVEYYKVEAPHSEVRIELPKGGYTPRFVRASDIVPPGEPAVDEPEFIPPPRTEAFDEHPSVAPRTQSRWPWVVTGFIAGVLLTILVGIILHSRGVLTRSAADNVSPELEEAWGPILTSTSPVKIIMSSPYQLWVRDYGDNPTPLVDPVDSPPMPDDPRLIRGYAQQMPLHADSKLYLHGNSAGALWGDAAGVQVGTRFLTENNVRTELVPEKSLKSGYVLRNDSFLAFGRSEYSPLMAGKIPADGFDVQYMPGIRRHGIALRTNPEAGLKFLATAGTPAINYGLITIIRDTADDGHPCQAMFFSGVISNGAQAAIEFMTTPRHVKNLLMKLKADGISKWPKVLQVVVRSETTEFYPIRTEYETHFVLQK